MSNVDQPHTVNPALKEAIYIKKPIVVVDGYDNGYDWSMSLTRNRVNCRVVTLHLRNSPELYLHPMGS